MIIINVYALYVLTSLFVNHVEPVDWCAWSGYTDWSLCSQLQETCPGGLKHRVRYRYCETSWNVANCYEQYCGTEPYHDTENCNWKCNNDGKFTDNLEKPCDCDDIHWGTCCQEECDTHTLDNCNIADDQYYCDGLDTQTKPRSICLQCMNSTKCISQGDKYSKCQSNDCTYNVADAHCRRGGRCHPRCNWLGHYCFPGTCDKPQYHPDTCKCQPGFNKTESGGVKCELNTFPELPSCRIGAKGTRGELATTVDDGCVNSKDVYINFIPTNLNYLFIFKFLVTVDENYKHEYITDNKIGITNARFDIIHHTLSGTKILTSRTLLDSGDCSITATQTPFAGSVNCNNSKIDFNNPGIGDAEKICYNFSAYGGGHYTVRDMSKSKDYLKIHFRDVNQTEEICFLTDCAKPEHCVNTDPLNCKADILEFGKRIRRDNILHIATRGWYDPYNQGLVRPSEIQEYQLTVYIVYYEAGQLNVRKGNDSIVGDPKTSVDGIFNVELPYPPLGEARMYALYIEARDGTQESPNVQEGRRMVLLDNSTYITTDPFHNSSLRAISASSLSNYTWQVHLGPIKLQWTDYFRNNYHVFNNLLLPIENDTAVNNTKYDQHSGELPILGTPNVHGIVKFEYRYQFANFDKTEFMDVSEFQSQSLDLDLPLQDGNVIVVDIQPIDIMNNTFLENITINIDSSPPILENLGLFKDGYNYLSVHNSKDLSKMTMQFDGFDPHSGIREVSWKLGHSPRTTDIGSDKIRPSPTNLTYECETMEKCGCPDIGECQHFNFTIDLNPIIANQTQNGDHNREYHFWIQITNNAFLETDDEFVILVDDSVPEVGVVLDGPSGSKDRDYQSISHLAWNWHGFIDHESGINKYHFAVGQECYTANDLKNLDNLSGAIHKGLTTFTFTGLEASDAGFYRLSVIAFNNAMDISKVACSSGILIDTTPPKLFEADLIGVRRQEGIACDDTGQKYYVTPSRRLRRLTEEESTCSKFQCQLNHRLHLMIPELLQNGTIMPPIDQYTSAKLCDTLTTIDKHPYMFMSSDSLWLKWKFEEPDSQMLDFYVGASRSSLNTEEPDILGYQSTHNHTWFKCLHCGFGEGDIFYLHLKASNKAGLNSVETFGPIIVDLTAPEFKGDLLVTKKSQMFIVSWNNTAFYDAEDDSLITEYYWALGVPDDLVSLETWTRVTFGYDHVNANNTLSVTYPAHKLQECDQDRGLDYVFSVQAVNRAGLARVEMSDPLTVHSKVVPTSGIVYHVDINRNEIGHQENTSLLCFRVYGFSHISEDFKLEIKLSEGLNSSHSQTITTWQEQQSQLTIYCKYNLDLAPLHMYHISLKACNEIGCSDMAHTKGIFIASFDDIIARGTVTAGLDCPGTFQHNIANNVTFNQNNGFEFTYNFTRQNSVHQIYTLRMQSEIRDTSLSKHVSVLINNDLYHVSSWRFDAQYSVLFFQILLFDDVTHLTIKANIPTSFCKIDIHACHYDISSQYTKSGLVSKWSFDPSISNYLSEFSVGILEQDCVTPLCSQETEVKIVNITGVNQVIVSDIPLIPGHKYITSVSPCFHNTCTTPIKSFGVLFDPGEPIIGSVFAAIDEIESLVNSNQTTKGTLKATWQPFRSSVSPQLNYSVLMYDWAVALSPTGGSLVTHWTRIQLDADTDMIRINTSVEIPVYRRRTLYLAIRFIHSNGLPNSHTQEIEMIDLRSSTRLEVFDLKADYNMNGIKDMIHSSNIGGLARELHDNDVDFSIDITSINGAVLGTACNVSNWAIQSDQDINCLTTPDDIACIAKKTEDNTVRFRRQQFEHGIKYYLCAYIVGIFVSGCPSTTACSNGFLIDTQPPVAGIVNAGANGVQADNSSMAVYWEGFVDIDERAIFPYIHGIKEYYISIGTSMFGDGSETYIPVGTADHTILTGLNLTSGVMYYVTVKGIHIYIQGLSWDAFSVRPGRMSSLSVRLTYIRRINDDRL